MKNAQKTIKTLIVGLIGLIGTLQLWFPVSFDGKSGSWLAVLEVALMTIGFFMFFFSMAWFLSLWIQTVRPETTPDDALRWEQKRAIGRTRYIRRFVAVWTVPSLTGILLIASRQLWESGFASGAIAFVIFLMIIVFLSVIGAGRAFWDYQEREYDRARKTLPKGSDR